MTHWIEFIGQEAIHALGWTFVHTLWQGSLLALIMMFVISRVPGSNAIARYRIAFTTLVLMLVSAVATFSTLYSVSPDPGYILQSSPASAAPAISEAGGIAAWFNANLEILVAIWLVGMVILLMRLGIGMLYIERLKRSTRQVGSEIERLSRQIAHQLNYKQHVRIAQTAMVRIPVVVGFLKPVILFPIGAVNHLTVDEVQAVLAHELAHLVRNDFLQNLVQSLIEVVFYYHPAVWWISAVVRSERENCCDDLAVKACGSSLTYANALVHLQDLGRTSPALALPFSGSKDHLLNRVKRILNQPQNKSNVMEKITATSLLVLCLIFASFTGKTDAESSPDVTTDYSMEFDFNFGLTDTVPPVGKLIVHQKINGEEVKLVYEKGEISSFEIDGVVVPEEEYEQHQALIDKLVEEVQNTPIPPAPPVPLMPGDLVPPPPPPAPHISPVPETLPEPEVAPTPPSAPTPGKIRGKVRPALPAPPAASPVPKTKKRSETLILRETDESGNIVYRIEREGDGTSDIVIDEVAHVALIDGQEVVIDADSIIVIEEVETMMPFGTWSDGHTFSNTFNYDLGNTNALFFSADSLHSDLGYVFEFSGDSIQYFGDSLHFSGSSLHFDDGTLQFTPQAWNLDKLYEFKLDPAHQYFEAKGLYNEAIDGEKMKKYLKEGGLPDNVWNEETMKAYNEALKEYDVEFGDQLKWEQVGEAWRADNDDQKVRIQRHKDMPKAEVARRLKESAEQNVRIQSRIHADNGRVIYGTPDAEVIADNFAFYEVLGGHQNRLLSEMSHEGLINPDGDYSVLLTDNKLKINGQRMPEEMLNKYKEMFKKVYGHEISGKTKLELSNN